MEKLEEQILRTNTEIKKCERLLEVLASGGRDKILANPEKMEEILFEGIEVRKQTQKRLDELHDEAKALGLQKEQVYRFKDKGNVQDHIKSALKLFEQSSSKRKQRLIQLMVPKLVLDEKQDQLFLFINPFLENSCKNSIEKFDQFEAILPQNLIQTEKETFMQVPEPSLEILSHGGKNVRVAEDWRGNAKLCKLIFIRPIYYGFTPYYVIPLFKNRIFIHQKYVVDGLSAKQIAKEIYCSKMAVLNALARFDISAREAHFHHGHPSQPRYGVKSRKKNLVDVEDEQRVIRAVNELRRKGFSLRQIAKLLNEMNVKTKCRGRSWHPEMVRRILGFIQSTDN